MKLLHDVPLALHSTMRLGGKAAYAVEITGRDDLLEAVAWAKEQKLPILMIGDGSNIVWRDEGFNGLLLINRIKGYTPFNEDSENYYLTVGAGENWDSVVERSVAAGASGIEALSLIPGTAGATPIQNVGAYGQEIAQTLTTIEAYDLKEARFVTLAGSDCGFAYRTSRFKTTDRGRFLILSITLHLIKTNPLPPYYSSVQEFFDQYKITQVTPKVLRDAVIAIRSSKLPDIKKVANNGSFFANPTISEDQFKQIQSTYPMAVNWPASDNKVKLSAAWLVEQAGFKNVYDASTGMATWPTQNLVLVNEHAKSTSDLLAFKQKIVDAVKAKFDITLDQEPELLP